MICAWDPESVGEIVVSDWGVQNWLITPAASPLVQVGPQQNQKWLIVLSGVGICNFKGQTSSGDWTRSTVDLSPDLEPALEYAISEYNLPRPEIWGVAYDDTVGLMVDQLTSFATINAIFEDSESVYAGFAVDGWHPLPYRAGTNVMTNLPCSNIFTGITVDAAVFDTESWLYRVGYHITLLGEIVFFRETIS
jgi:hypothetical protein